jgi:DNA adenine methylase
MPTLTPPLKWHGGKHYVARHVLALMPPHLHYVEPFFGGGQVLFARDPADRRLWWPGLDSDGRPVQGVSELVNDLDGDLMNFYAVLKDPEAFARLRHRLGLTLVSEAEWQAAGQLLAGRDGDPVERAAALFVSVRQSRQALRKDFTTPSVGRLRGGRQEAVNSWWGAVEGLEAAHRRLQDVLVLCRPALEVIRTQDAPATLFYLDPPYLHETRTARAAYGPHEMTEADHRALLQLLVAVRGKVILSGYASALYDRGLAGWSRHTLDVPNNAAGGEAKRRMQEVLWCNC